jgi:putative ABC transport system ATP-binding protein
MDTDLILSGKNIKKGYSLPGGDLFWALKGVDIDVPRSKLTILKGRSGSGKTTLMNILSGLDQATEGEVVFDDKIMTSLNEEQRTALRRRDIGFVFQSVALIPIMTAAENVDYALRLAGWKGDRKERVRECLELVGLGKRMAHLPSEMSGGEQQRVAIARAIAHQPKLVFADEPTGELDTNTALQVVKIFKELNRSQNVTIVMTTHDRGFMEIGDRVYALENGEFVDGN